MKSILYGFLLMIVAVSRVASAESVDQDLSSEQVERVGTLGNPGIRQNSGPFVLSAESAKLWPRRAEVVDQLRARAAKDDVEALMLLAELRIRSCGGDEVGAYLKRVIEIAPWHTRARLNLAVWHLLRDDLEEADRMSRALLEHLKLDSEEAARARRILKIVEERTHRCE